MAKGKKQKVEPVQVPETPDEVLPSKPVIERCGCPENQTKRNDELGDRCFFCGKSFIQSINQN